jgi:hypothetical protein
MESTIRFPENKRLQYIKIKKWEEDLRKGTDLIGFNALPGGYREVDVNFSPFINIVTRNYNSKSKGFSLRRVKN